MKRLGELSPDRRISMLDGSRFNGASSIELAAAMSQPAAARGFLLLFRDALRTRFIQSEVGEHAAFVTGIVAQR